MVESPWSKPGMLLICRQDANSYSFGPATQSFSICPTTDGGKVLFSRADLVFDDCCHPGKQTRSHIADILCKEHTHTHIYLHIYVYIYNMSRVKETHTRKISM